MSEVLTEDTIRRTIVSLAASVGMAVDEMLARVITRDILEQAIARMRDDDNAVATARDMILGAVDGSKIEIPEDAEVISDKDGVWVAAWIKVAEAKHDSAGQ